MSFDPRTTPVNDRVVAARLAREFPDRVAVQPERHRVTHTVLDLSLSPEGPRDRQMPHGWAFDILDRRGGLAFGFCPELNHVGWAEAGALSPDSAQPADTRRRVGVRQTRAYSEPDFKSPERLSLSHMSEVSVGQQAGRFTETGIGWIPSAHLTRDPVPDPVTAAERYLGTDYLWGGNSAFGIDCSGLIHAAMRAAGRSCPADSDQQLAGLGTALPGNTPVQRGDLLFWKGHVALALDTTHLIHANAFHMAVAIENREAAIARIADQGDGPVLAHKRLMP